MSDTESCPPCGGTGERYGAPCAFCRGSGDVRHPIPDPTLALEREAMPLKPSGGCLRVLAPGALVVATAAALALRAARGRR